MRTQGVLAMVAYGGVRAMFLGLKFHLKAIFLGLKFANMNFRVFGGKNFQQLPFSLGSICNTSKKFLAIKFLTKVKLSSLFLGQDHNIFGCKIYSESIFLGLNLTLHTLTPVYKYSKYPPPPDPPVNENWLKVKTFESV